MDFGDFFIAACQKHPELGIYVDHRSAGGTIPINLGPVLQ
jgi:hypothetical protein